MIVIKEGVDVIGLNTIMWKMIYDIKPLFDKESVDLVITSALDGTHRDHSKHYSGLAVDIRTRDLNDPKIMLKHLKTFLSNSFDVVYHSTHIHIEYDPRNQEDRLK